MARYNLNDLNPNDISTWPTESNQKYELDLNRGIFKADPTIAGDHRNMMEAIEMIGRVNLTRSESSTPSTVAAVESAVSNALKSLPVAPAPTVRKPFKDIRSYSALHHRFILQAHTTLDKASASTLAFRVLELSQEVPNYEL